MNSTLKAAFFHLLGKTECFESSIFSFKLWFGLHQVSNFVRLLFGAQWVYFCIPSLIPAFFFFLFPTEQTWKQERENELRKH